MNAALTDLLPNTTYYFRAVASGSAGSAVGTILNFTTGIMPTATTGQASDITSTTATLNATVNPQGGAATTAQFVYGTDATLTTGTTVVPIPALDLGTGTADVPLIEPLTGLLPETTYYFEVHATNFAGTTTGTIESFTTAAPTVSAPTITAGPATAVTATGATLNATVNPNGSATAVHFVYGTEETLTTGTTTTAEQDIGGGTTDVPVAAPVTGLQPGTTYYFQAVATSNGVATPGPIESFMTAAQPVIAPAATTGQASNVTGTTATLDGTVNPQGSATTAQFIYGTDATLTTGTTTVPIPALELGTGTADVPVIEPLTGLTPDTTYYYEVQATNPGGTTTGIIESFMTTAQTVVTPILTVEQATNVTNNGATVNATVNPNGVATTAYFVYGTEETLTSGTSTTAQQSIGSGTTAVPLTASLTGLQPGTTYYFEPVALSNGVTTPGPIESFTTTAAAAAGPMVTNLQRYGYHTQPTLFVLTFDQPLNPTAAQDLSNYQIVPMTSAGTGAPIPLSSAVYNASNNTVTLLTVSPVYLYGSYQLTVNGTPPSGLSNTTGQFLEGQGAGHPGTNYVTSFGESILAGPDVTASMSRATRARIMRTWKHDLAVAARIAARMARAAERRAPAARADHHATTATAGHHATTATAARHDPHAAAVDAVIGAIRVSKRK